MLRRTAGALIVAMALVAPVASAEEKQKDEKQAETRTAPRRQIRVLQDPKDISSYYSSEPRGARPSGPYGLSSYYRSSAQNRYGYYAWKAYAYEPHLYYGYDRRDDRRR